MTPLEFCYWLQGFFERGGELRGVSIDEAAMIKEHLKLVFNKVTNAPKSTSNSPYDPLRKVC